MIDYPQDASTEQSEGGETPEASQARWAGELADAKKKLRKLHERGQKIIREFRDERTSEDDSEKKLNLFSSNVQQVKAMLFGQVPKVDVTRRFADSNDSLARVAGELLGRLLNEDLHNSGEDQVLAFEQALSDRLLVGLGNARVRYAADFGPDSSEISESTTEEATEPPEVKTGEDVEVLYVHWRDQLWDPLARTFSECRWWAFRAYLTRQQLVKRFGEEKGNEIPLNAKRGDEDNQSQGGDYAQAEVWEVWDKDRREVCWYVEGLTAVLERKPPPMKLKGFWPFPRPMFANLTNDDLMPVPDYVLAQDQYKEINKLVTRRNRLSDALKAVGVYDQTAEGVSRMLQEGVELDLIPVPNWGAFSDKGGVAGAISWLPIDTIIAVMKELSEEIQERKAEIYEVTGWSDIMRGQQAENGTPGEAQVKAHFASARLNALLGEFSRFCSDVQRLRAEVVAELFDISTILQRSNAQFTYDAQVAVQAAQLLKSSLSAYRIDIKSDDVALADHAAARGEAVEVLGALGGFIQQAGSVAQAVPGSMPFLLEMLKWSVARLKGGQEIGGLLDRAIAAAQQPQGQAAPPPPDPKVQAAQIQSQSKAQELQMKAQIDAQHMVMETQQLAQRQKDQVSANITEEAAKAHIKAGASAAAAAASQGVTT